MDGGIKHSMVEFAVDNCYLILRKDAPSADDAPWCVPTDCLRWDTGSLPYQITLKFNEEICKYSR